MKELLNTGVSIGLEYCSDIDGIVGRIKDYSVAVRENNETGSYGILLWVKKGEFNAITSVNDYLADRVNSDSDTVKNFRVQERGVAVALKKTDDPFKNANTIKRFLIDLTNILSVNFYKSCCHKCGKTENLGIYLDKGVPSQYCSDCGAGKDLLKDFPEANTKDTLSFEALMPKPEAIAAVESVLDEAETKEAVEDEIVKNEAAEEAPESEAAEKAEEAEEMPEVELLPVGEKGEEAPEAEAEEEAEEMPEVELLPVGEKAEEAPEAETAEEADEEEMPGVVIPSSDNESEDDISDLLTESKTDYNGSYDAEVKKEEIPDNTDISALIMGGEDEKKEEYVPPKSELFERIEREYLEEQKNAQKTEEQNDFSGFMVTPLDNKGTKEDYVTVTETNEGPIGHNDKVAVTELRDDSNDGEDIDVTEIESTINKPTETTGHEQLTALETPLDENGNVPLINPNSESDDNKPSPADGPHAVLPAVSNKPMPRVVENDEPREIPPGYSGSESDPRAEVQKLPEQPRPYDAPAYVAPINWGIPSSNPVMGIIGALAFAVIGVLVWSLIGRLGRISYIGSIALVASIFGGYRLAGGSIDTKGKVICTVLSLLLTFISFWVVIVLNTQAQIHDLFGFNISFFNAIEWAVKAYSENRFVILDLIISMVFTVVAVVFTNKKIVQ